MKCFDTRCFVFEHNTQIMPKQVLRLYDCWYSLVRITPVGSHFVGWVESLATDGAGRGVGDVFVLHVVGDVLDSLETVGTLTRGVDKLTWNEGLRQLPGLRRKHHESHERKLQFVKRFYWFSGTGRRIQVKRLSWRCADDRWVRILLMLWKTLPHSVQGVGLGKCLSSMW